MEKTGQILEFKEFLKKQRPETFRRWEASKLPFVLWIAWEAEQDECLVNYWIWLEVWEAQKKGGSHLFFNNDSWLLMLAEEIEQEALEQNIFSEETSETVLQVLVKALEQVFQAELQAEWPPRRRRGMPFLLWVYCRAKLEKRPIKEWLATQLEKTRKRDKQGELGLPLFSRIILSRLDFLSQEAEERGWQHELSQAQVVKAEKSPRPEKQGEKKPKLRELKLTEKKLSFKTAKGEEACPTRTSRLLEIGETREHRMFCCPHYDHCLYLVAIRNWGSFSCQLCHQFEGEEERDQMEDENGIAF